jgi:DNA modification methylase
MESGEQQPPNRGAQYKRLSSGFMGKKWDGGDIAFRPELWEQVYRVLKPGAHLIAFSGTRTYHNMAVAIEQAGFEIRDQIGWMYGSGFPKSHDVSKGIDRAAGAERPVVSERFRADTGRNDNYGFGENFKVTAAATPESAEWEGWGTALKPAWEPCVLARKPLIGTVAQNVLQHGTGAINIDGCRVEGAKPDTTRGASSKASSMAGPLGAQGRILDDGRGRWPANIIHDGSDEVVAAFPESTDGIAGARTGQNGVGNWGFGATDDWGGYGGGGSAARFFYSAKADADDRLGSKHPTVKPVDLMQYLVRLVTPKGGVVLDPFAGTGTTGEAAFREGMRAILIEREEEYQADIRRRMSLVLGGPDERRRAGLKASGKVEAAESLPLFGGVE